MKPPLRSRACAAGLAALLGACLGGHGAQARTPRTLKILTPNAQASHRGSASPRTARSHLRHRAAAAGITFALHSDEPTRLFHAAPHFALTLGNAGKPMTVALRLGLYTLRGHLVAARTLRLFAPHGQTRLRQTFAAPAPGVYKVQLSLASNHASRSISFGVLPAIAAAEAKAAFPVSLPADSSPQTLRFFARLGLPRLAPIVPVARQGLLISDLPLPSDAPETSAATLRALISLRKTAPGHRPRIRVTSAAARPETTSDGYWRHAPETQGAAARLIERAVTAREAGCTDLGAAFSKSAPQTNAGLAAALAWKEFGREIGGGRYETSLFPASPLLRAVAFQLKAGRTAVLWLDRSDNAHARLVLPLHAARLFDLWGKQLGHETGGNLIVPLGDGPVYVRSSAPRSLWQRAWRAASLEGARPIAAQVLPFTAAPGAPANLKSLKLQVRLQNVSPAPFAGGLGVNPPAGWSLLADRTLVKLAPGEARVYSFPVAMSAARGDGRYAVAVAVSRGKTLWKWRQLARVAVAEASHGITIDGDLRDWRGAQWMATSAGPDGHLARLAVRWDAAHIYFAVRVSGTRLGARRDNNENYEFWHDNDAVELALGLADTKAVKPGRTTIDDTDFGFLLCPFSERDGAFEGRVLSLWGGGAPFSMAAAHDKVRWGGAVAAARCAVVYDEVRRETVYEASLPLTAMPRLRPAWRAKKGLTVRFGWKAFTADGPPATWSRATNVFAWWAGTGSFWPQDELSLAAQTPLGFEAASAPGGARYIRPAVRPPLRERLPNWLPPPAAPRPRFVPHPPTLVLPTPAHSTPAPTFAPPQVAPMAPSALPPATAPIAPSPTGPAPSGTPLPPTLPK